MRVLILGGTGDARRLATLATADGFDVTSSFAGRTAAPRLPDGAWRSGGFGGVAGLVAYLRDEHIDTLVDAMRLVRRSGFRRTRPRLLPMPCVPRLLLHRPPWDAVPGDRWLHATDIDDAASEAAGAGGAALFLTIGRQTALRCSHTWMQSGSCIA